MRQDSDFKIIKWGNRKLEGIVQILSLNTATISQFIEISRLEDIYKSLLVFIQSKARIGWLYS